jgi:hypothetical protein
MNRIAAVLITLVAFAIGTAVIGAVSSGFGIVRRMRADTDECAESGQTCIAWSLATLALASALCVICLVLVELSVFQLIVPTVVATPLLLLASTVLACAGHGKGRSAVLAGNGLIIVWAVVVVVIGLHIAHGPSPSF